MSPGQADKAAEGLIEGILQRGEQPAVPDHEDAELLTFLIADIRGYTMFTQQRGDEAAASLTATFAVIVRDTVAQFGGTVFELRGDEALCVFRSPRQSLRAAVALQQRFVEETAADPSRPMTVGIGIDAGEAVRGPDGYRGGALNLAARLCSHAKGGDVLASPEVAHLARTIDGIRYVSLDRVALKGLPDQIRPVRVVPDDEDPAMQIAALLAAAAPTPTPGRVLRRLPAPLARRPRMTAAIAAAVVVLVATTLVVLTTQDSGGGSNLLRENSVGEFDPQTRRFVAQADVDSGPVAVAVDKRAVWTVNADANSVSRVDKKTHQVRSIPVGVTPSAIAVGPGAVWVANSGGESVSRIDPSNYDVVDIAGVGAAPGGIAVGRGSVWVTNTGDATVSRIDPTTNTVVERIKVGTSPTGIAVDSDIWVANSGSNTVSQINGTGRTHAEIHVFPVGSNPKGVAVVRDSVWVTNNIDSTISRISTLATHVLPGGPTPGQIALADGHVWVASQSADTLTEVDARSGRMLGRPVHVGAIPGGIVADGGKLWVTATIDHGLHRGGTLHLLGTDIGSVDPTYLGSLEVTYLLNIMYDGLVGFRQATGADATAIVPDLALALPRPTNSGRTYTFHLRTGVRWSDGRLLTAGDVRRGLERSILWGNSNLEKQVVGSDRCTKRQCDVRGIVADDAARTVTITLEHANGDFLDDLAGGNYAVPEATPLSEQDTVRVPATGPYRIARYVPGQGVTLTRNPYFHEWSAAAQPDGLPDTIEWRIDPNDNASNQMKEVAAGHADWIDARDAGAVPTLQASFGSRVRITPTETMHGVFLNTKEAPFNVPAVRRALALALDRDSIAQAWPGQAKVTCQVLPPNYVGHRPYCPFTLNPDNTARWRGPDLARALNLIESEPAPVDVTVWTASSQAPGMSYVVAALVELGYRAKLSIFHGSTSDYFDYARDPRNHVQAGFFGWVAADASAANFLKVFRCDAIATAQEYERNRHASNLNPANFCDESIDRLMDKAAAAETTSLAEANQIWAQVDHRLVDAAPWIPLVTPSWVDLLSARVHNYQRSPVLGVLFDQMWVD